MGKKYLYESHLGGMYSSDKKYSDEELYCEDCGDWDTLIGTFKDAKSLRKLLKSSDEDLTDSYIEETVAREFPSDKDKSNFTNPVLMKNGYYVEQETFDNPYNLGPKTIADDYKVNDYKSLIKRNKLGLPTLNKYGSPEAADDNMWYNGAIKAVCSSAGFGSDGFCDSEFWIGLYEDGHIKVYYSADEGMCGYNFDKFGDTSQMDNQFDYKCQAEALKRMNYLIDKGYIVKK